MTQEPRDNSLNCRPLRPRKHRKHPLRARPLQRLVLKPLERNHLIHESHLEGFLRAVLAAEVPDLARLLVPDDAREVRRAVAGVERADLRAGLAEARVVGGDRQVADEVQHVPAADRVARDDGDDRLRDVADELLQVEHVQPRHLVLADVAAVPAHALVAARAEGLGPLAGEEHDARRHVLARVRERVDELRDGERAEGVAHLGPVDRDLRDRLVRQALVADVRVFLDRLPVGASFRGAIGEMTPVRRWFERGE